MNKIIKYKCSNCGYLDEYSGWGGRKECPNCERWSTFTKVIEPKNKNGGSKNDNRSKSQKQRPVYGM